MLRNSLYILILSFCNISFSVECYVAALDESYPAIYSETGAKISENDFSMSRLLKGLQSFLDAGPCTKVFGQECSIATVGANKTAVYSSRGTRLSAYDFNATRVTRDLALLKDVGVCTSLAYVECTIKAVGENSPAIYSFNGELKLTDYDHSNLRLVATLYDFKDDGVCSKVVSQDCQIYAKDGKYPAVYTADGVRVTNTDFHNERLLNKLKRLKEVGVCH